MIQTSSRGDGRGLARPSSRRLATPARRVSVSAGSALALAFLLAAPVAAEPAMCAQQSAAAARPVAWSRPVDADPAPDWSYARFRGLGCERCRSRTQYCVVNFVRWEYVCAPRGNTFACAGFAGTRWCRFGQTCWDGVCR